MQCVGGTNTLTEFTKSKASRRSLSMSTTMFDYLVQLKAEQEENKKKFGSQYDSTGYVCCHADGKPLRAEDITSRFAKTIKELGFEELSVHSLRHTVATKLARNNIAIAKVQKFLGHESPLTTARYYVHIPQEDSLECADILSSDVFVYGGSAPKGTR